MVAGWWRQAEMFDGTYSFLDAVEANRMLDIVEENRRRARAAAEEKMQRR